MHKVRNHLRTTCASYMKLKVLITYEYMFNKQNENRMNSYDTRNILLFKFVDVCMLSTIRHNQYIYILITAKFRITPTIQHYRTCCYVILCIASPFNLYTLRTV